MAGFLDKQDTIIDMVLTDEGKHQLSLGELEFCYFSLFDDEIDYDPYISNSASLSPDQLSASIGYQVENSLVREAVTGYSHKRSRSCIDTINVNKPLFTIPQGNITLPRASYAPNISSGTVDVLQRKTEEFLIKKDLDGKLIESVGPIDAGFDRFNPTSVVIDVGVDDFFDESVQQGFLLRVFKSGSDGFSEVSMKRDFVGDVSYELDLKTFADSSFNQKK